MYTTESSSAAAAQGYRRSIKIITQDEVPPIESLLQLLSLPGKSFLRAAYRHVLKREIDAEGLQHHIERLSRGVGKDKVLTDLINSQEARNLSSNNYNDSCSSPATLLHELEQLQKTHKTGLISKWMSSRPSNTELNALEFRLESTFSSMLEGVRDCMIQEFARRDVSQANADSVVSNARVVDAVQAQRRAVSRPVGQR